MGSKKCFNAKDFYFSWTMGRNRKKRSGIPRGPSLPLILRVPTPKLRGTPVLGVLTTQGRESKGRLITDQLNFLEE